MALQNRLKSISIPCPMSYNEDLRKALKGPILRPLSRDIPKSRNATNKCSNYNLHEVAISNKSSAAFEKVSESVDNSNKFFKDSGGEKNNYEISVPLLKSIFEQASAHESLSSVLDLGNKIPVSQSFIPTSDLKRRDDKNQSVYNGSLLAISTGYDSQDSIAVKVQSSHPMFDQENKYSTNDYRGLSPHSEFENGRNMPDPLLDRRIEDSMHLRLQSSNLGNNDIQDGLFSLIPNRVSDFNIYQSVEDQESKRHTEQHACMLSPQECLTYDHICSLPILDSGDCFNKYSNLLPTQINNYITNPYSDSFIHSITCSSTDQRLNIANGEEFLDQPFNPISDLKGRYYANQQNNYLPDLESLLLDQKPSLDHYQRSNEKTEHNSGVIQHTGTKNESSWPFQFVERRNTEIITNMETEDEQNPSSELLYDKRSSNILNPNLDILSHQFREPNEEQTQLLNILFVKAEEHNQNSDSLSEDSDLTVKAKQVQNGFIDESFECNTRKTEQMDFLISDESFDYRTLPILADYDSIEDPFENLFDQSETSYLIDSYVNQYLEQEKWNNHASYSQIKEQTHFGSNKCEESYISYDDLSRRALEKKLDSYVFIKQKQDSEYSSYCLSRPIIENIKQGFKTESTNKPCFLTKKSEEPDIASNKATPYLISVNEGSEISYNEARQFIANKIITPDSYYSIPLLSVSESEGSYDSFYNRSPFFNKIREEPIASPDFLTQGVNGETAGPDFQASHLHRYLYNSIGGLDGLPNITPFLPISMSEILDTSSNNKSPFYEKKKKNDPRFVCSENRGSETGDELSHTQFFASGNQGLKPEESSRVFFNGNQGSKHGDESSRFVFNGNQGSKDGDESSRFVFNGNQGSGVQFGGPFPLQVNRNKTADAEYSNRSRSFIGKAKGSNQHERNQNSASKPSFNIFVAGPENCGKIQLINSLTGTNVVVSKVFNSSCVALMTDRRTGVDFYIWYVRNLIKSLLFVAGICSREKSAILLVYNVIKYDTLSDLDDQIKVAKGRLGNEVPIVLVGNKVDVRTPATISEFERAGKPINFYADGHEMKEKHGLQDFFECSGKTGQGVDEIFRRAADLAIKG